MNISDVQFITFGFPENPSFISNSALAVDKRTPSAPVTNLRANAAHVSGLALYGCKNNALFLALALDSTVACVNGFSLTNEWPSFNIRAAEIQNLKD